MTSTQTPTPENLRAKEASQYLGIGLSTLWLYAKQGKLKPIKLSQRVTIFKKSDLDQFINSMCEG
jgi:excisionase family DNA binding protein